MLLCLYAAIYCSAVYVQTPKLATPPAGHDVTYNITSVAGGPSCQVRVRVLRCPAPACTWNSNTLIQLPQAGGGTCNGAVLVPASLYGGVEAVVSPSLPSLYTPGRCSLRLLNWCRSGLGFRVYCSGSG